MNLANVKSWKQEQFLYIWDNRSRDSFELSDEFCVARQEIWRVRNHRKHHQWEKDLLIQRSHEEALEMNKPPEA